MHNQLTLFMKDKLTYASLMLLAVKPHYNFLKYIKHKIASSIPCLLIIPEHWLVIKPF